MEGVNTEFVKKSTVTRWTHFLDDEVRRCTKVGRGMARLRDLQKKERLPHHFFMGMELAKVGASKVYDFALWCTWCIWCTKSNLLQKKLTIDANRRAPLWRCSRRGPTTYSWKMRVKKDGARPHW
jgi:hypothetical protein